MIETNRRDDAQKRMHHVGRIEPPTEPGLDHRDIDILIGKILKHQRDGEFEKRQREARILVDRAQLLDVIEHPARGDLGAIDAGALRQIDQMRFGVEANAQTRGAQAAIEHRGHASLCPWCRRYERRAIADEGYR